MTGTLHHTSLHKMTEPRQQQQQARHWCWTLNNWTQEEHDQLMLAGAQKQTLGIRYLIFGREIGQQGTPHLQGYIMMTSPVRWTTLNNRLHITTGRIHWERMMGTPQQAADYCKKDGDYTEFGTLPAGNNTNQYTIIAQRIGDGASTQEIRDEFPGTWLRFHTAIDRWINEGRQQRLDNFDGDLQTKNLWIWGPPGIGKSRYARSLAERCYNKPANKWWDGYAGEPVVIIEDMDPDRAKILTHQLKIWLDRYIFTAEVKNGSTILSPKDMRMVITSNYSPDQCFTEPDLSAIRRRTHVMHMDTL